jgi:hypothetical protein
MQEEKISIKKLMKDSGVTLSDVAKASGHDRSAVCHAIDEDLIAGIQQTALKLIEERNERVGVQLSLFKDGAMTFS